ncbi:MAG TPA: family 10 glycosylhydrolase [Pyrinomonadaceae bacterium]|nr:family 10 glycosylhydrolase [Pyrinomonadaceae bacterium]
MRKQIFTLLLLSLLSITAHSQSLPKPEREFRAAWIATVDNIDFPTRKDLSVEQQKTELLESLELARSLKLNAVIFQVRPQCDALYKSNIEPWSEFLTGEMGKAQSFDPLEFLVAEAHQRGILVHAWFNPYRALHPAAKTVSENHISKRRPDLVRQYGKFLWLDPGDPEVQAYSLSVVMDVVRRYDVDGVHFDDYFYPYPEKDAGGAEIEFPDDVSWQKYRTSGGKLARDDWRRKNVNDFIEAVGREIKRIKPEILYGVSPFGIWQPVPEKGITGFNAYNKLYADARKWLQDGTVDYLAPQLYWETARKGQSFPILFDWWKSQNTKGRHVWAGIASYRIGSNENFTAEEISNQIKLTKGSPVTLGAIHFSFKSLRSDLGGIQKSLRQEVYARDALIPTSPWIKTPKILRPEVKFTRDGRLVRAAWKERGARKAFWFVVYARDKNGWSYSVLPAAEKAIALSADRAIEKIVVTSVDRLGNESAF